MHWADKYVGEEGIGKRCCWELLRKVWLQEAGHELPSYNEDNDGIRAIAERSKSFEDIELADLQPLDAVFMKTDILVGDRWIVAEAHIGIFVQDDLILHVEMGSLAIIEPMKLLRVTRAKAGPLHKFESD